MIEAKIAEEIFDVAVVEYALQAETCSARALLFCRRRETMSCISSVSAHDVVAVAGRIRACFLGVKEGQQHAAGLEQRPEPPDHRLHQAFIQIVGQVPAQHDIELRRRKYQVFFQEALAVEGRLARFILDGKRRIGGGNQQVVAVDLVSTLGAVADVGGRGRPQIEYAEGFFRIQRL